MRRVITTVAHEVPRRPAVRLGEGEVVDVGERSEEWPAFMFVTAANGSGWVPARHLSARSGAAVMLEPYDTTEMAAAVGDILVVVREDRESGWLWCRSEEGSEGWVPVESVRPAD